MELLLATAPQEIQNWIEQQEGQPTLDTQTNPDGQLKILFTESPDHTLQKLGWEEFFAYLEDRDLAFFYDNEGTNYYKIAPKDSFIDLTSPEGMLRENDY